jgi:hypothetical protein
MKAKMLAGMASAVFAACGSAAWATPLPVTNASFEDPVLGEDVFTQNNTIPGWSTTLPSGTFGVWNPGEPFRYPVGAVPDGNNVVYNNDTNIHIFQVTSHLLGVGGYTLQVDIGNRADGFTMQGYKVQLRAGGAVLAEDNDSLNPAPGTFLTSTLQYTATAADPQLGEALEIRLIFLAGSQANYDHVRLDGPLSIPEPGTLGVLGLGGVARSEAAERSVRLKCEIEV